MLMFLQENPEMRFVYAEMSFFELWWSEIDHAKRTVVKKLNFILFINFIYKSILI